MKKIIEISKEKKSRKKMKTEEYRSVSVVQKTKTKNSELNFRT